MTTARENERQKANRVLIVDDDRVVCTTLAHILKSHGYETRTAGSAEEALAMIAAWRPEAAIVDVCLPQMSGVELAARFRQECPDCHILLFSGRLETAEIVNDDEIAQTLKLIAKPVHPTVLLDWLSNQPKAESDSDNGTPVARAS